MEHLQPLDVGCFELPSGWSQETWQGCSLSRQALVISLLHELAAVAADPNEQPTLQPPKPGDVQAWMLAAHKTIRSFPKDPGRYSDSSKFSGDEDYPRLAREEVVRYYRKQNPDGLPIDIDEVRVQIECFCFRNASFRIDVQAAQKPGFVPLHTSYTMAHRLCMRRSGQIILSEPIYRSQNLANGESEETLPPTSRGFFPGMKSFEKPLQQIDAALRTVGKVGLPASLAPPKASTPGLLGTLLRRFRPPPSTTPSGPHLTVAAGLADLARYQANIRETTRSFRITVESGRAGLSEVFGPSRFLHFDVDKESQHVSPLTVEIYAPPALQ